MRSARPLVVITLAAAAVGFGTLVGHDRRLGADEESVARGQQIFRYDTFGDEQFWTDKLGLNEVIESSLDPTTALSLGLKIDVDALPEDVVAAIKAGEVDLTDPAVTVALIKLNAVVGVVGTVESIDGKDRLTKVGITCAICHSTVDDAFAPGIGRRLDGWPNRDLDVGKVITLAPELKPITDRLGVTEGDLKKALLAWGPGKYDAEVLQDGKAVRPDGKSAATLLPAAFGQLGINAHTYSGWGSVTHWNAYVANTQMHGKGTFFDPRLKDEKKFPVAAKAGDWNIRNDPDLVTSKLAALQFYQLALAAPKPPAGTFDAAAAARGQAVFNGKADCKRCHVPPLFTEPGWPMHTADEIGIDDFQAKRSPDGRYRTTPLAGLFTRTKGGFYHDGRFATLSDVVKHYDAHFKLKLTDAEVADLVEYLKSL